MPTERVTVAVRLRPLKTKSKSVICDGNMLKVVVKKTSTTKHFEFDSVFDQGFSDQQVYESVAVPKVDAFCNGHNATIFCYGRSASGKTHTISHIIHSAVEDIFNGKFATENPPSLSIGVLEICENKVFDLIQNHDVRVRMSDERAEVRRQGFTTVHSISTATQLIESALEKRIKRSTNVNKESSRSHCFVTFAGSNDQMLHFVDLAGDENSKDVGLSHKKETKAINTSLGGLNALIKAMGDRSFNWVHFPSPLAMLMRNALHGNTTTAMVACISPTSDAASRNLHILDMAKTVMRIRTTPVSLAPSAPAVDSVPATPREQSHVEVHSPFTQLGHNEADIDETIAELMTAMPHIQHAFHEQLEAWISAQVRLRTLQQIADSLRAAALARPRSPPVSNSSSLARRDRLGGSVGTKRKRSASDQRRRSNRSDRGDF